MWSPHVAGDRSPIEGTADTPGASVEDVGVDHRGADIFVAQQFLDCADVVAVIEEMGGE